VSSNGFGLRLCGRLFRCWVSAGDARGSFTHADLWMRLAIQCANGQDACGLTQGVITKVLFAVVVPVPEPSPYSQQVPSA
jgi:hypothetical protein